MAAHPLDTLVVHPGALGDVLQAVPALRALTALGHRLTFAGQPRIGELLDGLGVVCAHTSFDTFGLEALFVEGPPPASLRSGLGQFPRAVSWFGVRDPCYVRQLAALIPASIVAAPVPEAGALRTVWEHLVDTLAPWCRPGTIDASSLRVPEGWRAAARAALTAAGADLARPFLLAHPGAGSPWKQSPASRFARVLERLA